MMYSGNSQKLDFLGTIEYQMDNLAKIFLDAVHSAHMGWPWLGDHKALVSHLL
jgi:hypothetical protein